LRHDGCPYEVLPLEWVTLVRAYVQMCTWCSFRSKEVRPNHLLHCAMAFATINIVRSASILVHCALSGSHLLVNSYSLDAPIRQSATHSVIPEALEKKLRTWWGNVNFGEFQQEVDIDTRNLGYDLSKDFDQSVEIVMAKIADRHNTGKPCASLPTNISLHAWRYNDTDLDRCLNLDASDGTECTLRCKMLPRVSTTVQCKKYKLSWLLTGEPPHSKCLWVLDKEVINTTGGLVQGLTRPIRWKWATGYVSTEWSRTFWGIPYADHPGRFALAQPLSRPWVGVRVTDYFDVLHNFSQRMHCAGAAPLDPGLGTEDCLFLDIYVPSGASPSSRRPVMFFFFAAGFVMGDAWQGGHLEGTRIAIKDNVVVIIVSSRTAALGHWAHPALTRTYGDDSAGNLGERDQREALQWVKANIRAFGGDPQRVTLVGHSSGAFAATFHLYSPASHGLFSGAILESTTFDSGWYWQNKEQAFTFYSELGASMGCPQDNGSGEQIHCLRTLPMEKFYNVTARQLSQVLKRLKRASKFSDAWSLLEMLFSAVFGLRGSFRKVGLLYSDSYILASPLWPLLPFGLTVDGSKAGVPTPPRQLYTAGRAANVPVYINHEHDEGTMFAVVLAIVFPWQATPSLTHDSVDAMFQWAYGANANLTNELIKLYPHGTHMHAPFYRLSGAITDIVFKCSAWRFAAAQSAARRGPTYWAEHTFHSHRSKTSAGALIHRDFEYFLGAHHGMPSKQIFGQAYSIGFWQDVDQKNHDVIHCHFALMFHCGNPGATPESKCRRKLIGSNITLHSCAMLKDHEIYPFDEFDAASPRIKELNPSRHGMIVPSEAERQVCEFWDVAPSMNFQQNSCRGCAPQTGPSASQRQNLFI